MQDKGEFIMLRFILHLVILIFFCFSCGKPTVLVVQTGLDRVGEFAHLFSGKRIGIVTNHTAYNISGDFISDVFQKIPETKVVALFGPEHGIRGSEAAGRIITDQETKGNEIPIYSLYGKVRKPTAEMLQNIDVLVYDIQDIGTRYYTYISTMCLSMEAAAENDIPFIVLDRPNPINGIAVEGNILDMAYSSFVGLYPIPVRHGMTTGEIAMMVNGEGWLKGQIDARLSIVPLKDWPRSMWYDETGLTWRAPSPNMPDLNVATVYPGTCLFEGTNISEGRGTYQPFLRIGAPWISEAQLDAINSIITVQGVHLGPIEFTPRSIPGMAPHPKFENEKLTGVLLRVTNRNKFRPYLCGIALVKYFYDLDPESFQWKENHFDRLCGTSKIRQMIMNRKSISEIREWIDAGLIQFADQRARYLLY
jgi:uncharacterized protein YbbC (DUF1343 family)